MSPTISVCLTTYNRAPLLDRTLKTLAVQSRLPDELIISDDHSTDHTPEIVEKWKPSFPQLRYNRNLANLCMPGNLNVAVGLATGDYVANVHDGDEYHPQLLEKWAAALNAYPTAGFVFCAIANWLGLPSALNTLLHDISPMTPGRIFYETYFRHRWGSIVWGTVMARRSAYEHLLPFDPAYGFISDVDMWMRMCVYYDVAYVCEPLITIDHSPSKERGFRWTHINSMRRIQLANLKRFYADQPARLRREIARHRLAVHIRYLRGIVGGIKHRDWMRIREGFKECREIGWPLRILGLLAKG